MVAPMTPEVVRVKSLNGALTFTPVTTSENVIMKPTLDALVGFVLASVIEETTGIVFGVWVAVGVKVGVLVGVCVEVGVLVAVLVGIFVAVLGFELQV